MNFREHSQLHSYKEAILYSDSKTYSAEEIIYSDLMNLKTRHLLNCEQQKTQHCAAVSVSWYVKLSLLMGIILKWEHTS